jgi:hypothetical protein
VAEDSAAAAAGLDVRIAQEADRSGAHRPPAQLCQIPGFGFPVPPVHLAYFYLAFHRFASHCAGHSSWSTWCACTFLGLEEATGECGVLHAGRSISRDHGPVAAHLPEPTISRLMRVVQPAHRLHELRRGGGGPDRTAGVAGWSLHLVSAVGLGRSGGLSGADRGGGVRFASQRVPGWWEGDPQTATTRPGAGDAGGVSGCDGGTG